MSCHLSIQSRTLYPILHTQKTEENRNPPVLPFLALPHAGCSTEQSSSSSALGQQRGWVPPVSPVPRKALTNSSAVPRAARWSWPITSQLLMLSQTASVSGECPSRTWLGDCLVIALLQHVEPAVPDGCAPTSQTQASVPAGRQHKPGPSSSSACSLQGAPKLTVGGDLSPKSLDTMRSQLRLVFSIKGRLKAAAQRPESTEQTRSYALCRWRSPSTKHLLGDKPHHKECCPFQKVTVDPGNLSGAESYPSGFIYLSLWQTFQLFLQPTTFCSAKFHILPLASVLLVRK